MELYVYLDESGNFDFSNKQGASKWIIITSLSTTNPEEGLIDYYRLKHKLIKGNYDVSSFHATEDKQVIRNQFFSVIAGLSNARIDGLAIRKNRLTPEWRKKREFYPIMLEYLLKYVFHPSGLNSRRFEHIYIFLAKMQLAKREREPMIFGIKRFLRHRLSEIPFTVSLHSCESNPYLQMVDYCCWSLFVKRERNELRPYNRLLNLVKSDFDIFECGETNWY